MLIPALVPALSVLEVEAGDASDVAALVVVAAGETVGDTCDEEDKDEEEGVEASDVKDEKENAVGDIPVDDKDATAVGTEASPSWPRAETPQV